MSRIPSVQREVAIRKLFTDRGYTPPTGADLTALLDDAIDKLLEALDASAGSVPPFPISDITGLQGALDGKAALVHTHAIADSTGLQAALDGKAALAHVHDAGDVTTGTMAPARLPVATTAAKGVVAVDNNGAGAPVALTSAGHALDADPHPQYALDSEKGALNGLATLDGGGKLATSQLPLGTTASTAAAGNDSRLTDARTPVAHASSHQPGGSDAMAVDAVAATGSLRTLGTGAQQAAAGTDSRFTDARTPTAHATSHQTGSDKIATGTPDGTKFLRDDFSWQAPTASTPEVLQTNNAPAADRTVSAGYSVFADEEFVVADGVEFALSDGASLVVL